MNSKSDPQFSSTSFFCELCETMTTCIPHFAKKGIVQCTQCTLVFFPLEKTENVHSLYGDAYFQGGEYADYVGDQKIHEWNFAKRIDYLKSLKPSGTLFEIGSAYGFFLNLAKKFWKVRGIEISASGVKHAQGKLNLTSSEIQQGDLLKLENENAQYDLVCLWDTLEHLDHPKKFVKKAASFLSCGGHLVLTTCDIGSHLAKFQKERWRQIHPPTHLYYFDKNTLKALIQGVGLEWVESRSIGITRSYKSMLHGLFAQAHTGSGLSKPSRLKWIYQLLTLNGRLDFPVYLNTGDLIQVTARKP